MAKANAELVQGKKDEPAEFVKVKANPALFKSRGQVKLVAGGKEYLVRNDQPLEVSREVYEELRKTDIRGRQAVVLD